jgi:hypothetical protein
LGLLDIASKSEFYFVNTFVYVFWFPLDKHFNVTTGEVTDKAGQLMAAGNPVSGEAKTNTLDLADEYYTLGSLIHFLIDYLLFIDYGYCILAAILTYGDF